MEAIIGLERRGNPELSRMCADYVAELAAAGREIATDIWLPLAPHANPAGLAQLRRHLSEPNPLHRFYAARAAASVLHKHPELRADLAMRLGLESDGQVRRVLATAILH